MSFIMDKEMFKQFEKKGRKKIIGIGGSSGVTIPKWLFHLYWKKEDYLDIYLINSYTLVLVNKNAKERKEQKDKINVKVESKDALY